MIALMDNGKWAHVTKDAVVGQTIEVWCVRSGKMWQGKIVSFI